MIPERDIKFAKPIASRNQKPLNITEVGKKAKSRLFSYEEAHTQKTQEMKEKQHDAQKKSLQQVRKAAYERREKIEKDIQEQVRKEKLAALKKAKSRKEQSEIEQELRLEANLRKEIGSTFKMLNEASGIAFKK